MMSNYGVAALGHADPVYAAAMADQLQKLTTCHQSFYNDARAAALAAIRQIAPDGLTRYFMSNSGAEAIEAGLKFAMMATERHNIVALRRGYHGRTLGALSATFDPKYRKPFEPLPIPVTHVAFNDYAALAEQVRAGLAAFGIESVLPPVQSSVVLRSYQLPPGLGYAALHDGLNSAANSSSRRRRRASFIG